MLILSPIPSLIKGDSEGSTFFPKKDLTNLGEWMTGVIANSPKTYSLIETYLKQVMPDFEEMNNEVIRGEFRSLSVRFKQDQADLTLPASQLSDGEKCFLICSLVLAANKAYGPIFCFWDEPDNYLSLTEVGHFVTSLRKAFKDNGQLLITSHNPEAIRKFSDETTLLLYRASHFEPTQIRPLSELQIEGDLIGAIIRDEIEPAG